jgi:hypothetical protein
MYNFIAKLYKLWDVPLVAQAAEHRGAVKTMEPVVLVVAIN